MSKKNAPLSRKEEEEKNTSENNAPQLMPMKKGSMFAKFDDLAGFKRKAFANMYKKKSTVSQPGDPAELQADTVAKAVTEGNANAAQAELQNDVSSSEITAKASDVSIETPEGFEEQLEKMKGGGLPLPDDKKEYLEEMLGTDLDDVRLHTGADAAELANAIYAEAFAWGKDIVYPGNLDDEELLTHEVTHTVQGEAGSADTTGFTLEARTDTDMIRRTDGIPVGSGRVEISVTGTETPDELKIKAIVAITGMSSTEAATRISNYKFSGKWEVKPGDTVFDFKVNSDSPAGGDEAVLKDISGMGEDVSDEFRDRLELFKTYGAGIQSQINNEADRRLFERTGHHLYDTFKDAEEEKLIRQEWIRIRDEVIQEYNTVAAAPSWLTDALYDGKTSAGSEPVAFKDLKGYSNMITQMKDWSSSQFVEFKRYISEHSSIDGNQPALPVTSFFENFKKENEKKTDVQRETAAALFGLEKVWEKEKHFLQLVEQGEEILQPAYDDYEKEAKKNGLTPEEFVKRHRDFLLAFESTAIDVALNMLFVSEKIIQSEKVRYANTGTTDFGSLFDAVASASPRIKELKDAYDSASLPMVEYGKYTKSDLMQRDYYYEVKSKYENSLESLRQSLLQTYPILADEDLDIQDLVNEASSGDKGGFLSLLYEVINEKQENISSLRATLKDPESRSKVWKMDNAINMAMIDYYLKGIMLGKIHEDIIASKKDYENSSLADIMLGILAFLAALSGPFTAGVGFYVAAGIGGVIATKHLIEYSFENKASNTAFDQQLSLMSEEPSLAWVIVDFAFVALDLGTIAAEIRAVRTAVKSFLESGKQTVQSLTRTLEQLLSKVGFRPGFTATELAEQLSLKAELLRTRKLAQAENIKTLEALLDKALFKSIDDLADESRIGLAEALGQNKKMVEGLISRLGSEQLNSLGGILYHTPAYTRTLVTAYEGMTAFNFGSFADFITGTGRYEADDLLRKMTEIREYYPQQYDELLKGFKTTDLEPNKLVTDFKKQLNTTYDTVVGGFKTELKTLIDDGINAFKIEAQYLKERFRQLIESIADFIRNMALTAADKVMEFLKPLVSVFDTVMVDAVDMLKRGNPLAEAIEKMENHVMNMWGKTNLESTLSVIHTTYLEMKTVADQLNSFAKLGSERLKSGATFFLHRLKTVGSELGDLVQVNKELERLFARTGDNEILGEVLWIAASSQSKLSGEVVLRWTNNLLDLGESLPKKNLMTILTKMKNGQLSESSLDFIVSTLKNPKLSEQARTRFLGRLDDTRTHFEEFQRMVTNNTETIDDINRLLEEAGTNQKLLDKFPHLRGTTNNRVTNLTLINDTEPDLAMLIQGYEMPVSTGSYKLSDKLKTALNDLINSHTANMDGYLASERGALSRKVNETIAANVTDQNEMLLVTETMTQQGSRGSVFENWQRVNKDTFWKDTGLGEKLTFEAATLKKYKSFENFDGSRIIVDAHYSKNGITGVEFKHVAGALSGEQLVQARNYVNLIEEGLMQRIEYVFSTKSAAMQNKKVLTGLFDEKVTVLYFENGIKKAL